MPNEQEDVKGATAEVVNTESTDVAVKTETVVVFKVNRPLTAGEYEELESRVRAENEKSGLKIVLAPYSVDVTLG